MVLLHNFGKRMLLLPDEIWITILYEWMDKTTTLCAFDMALCNQVLRERYLRWFQPAPTVAQLSNIPFEIVQSKRNMSQNTLELFFTWCKKRKIYPKSLLLGLFSVKNQEKKKGKKRQQNQQQSPELLFDWSNKLGTLQHLETLGVFDSHNVVSNETTNFMNLLNLFPNLQKLLVMYEGLHETLGWVNLHHSYYPLITLELDDAIFNSDKKEFERLVQVCPMLQEVKLTNCYGMHFHHIDYLITHAKYLTTVLYYPCRENEHSTLIPIVNGDIVSTSMKCLYFELTEEENDAAETIACYDNVCTILSKCPLLEKLHLYELNFDPEHFATSRLKQVIKNSWQHLEALRILRSTFPFEMLQQIANTCSNTLKRLYIQHPFEIRQDELATVITKSFPHLQSFTIDVSHLDDYDYLMGSSFCNSLQSLEFSPTRNVFEREDFLTAFPALLSLSLFRIDFTPLITPYNAMSRIRILNLRSNYCDSLTTFLLVEAIDVGRIKKKTINVDLPPIDHLFLNLSGYASLKDLSLESMYLYPTELSIILCLPSLTRLKLTLIYCKHQMILFHPDNYPATNLAPLETLSFISDTKQNRLCCSEHQIRVLLSRFTTLQMLIIPVDLFKLDESTWNNMKKVYQYRVALKSQFEDIFEEYCSLANEDKLQDPL